VYIYVRLLKGGNMIGKICSFCKNMISHDHHQRTIAHGLAFCCLKCVTDWEDENPP